MTTAAAPALAPGAAAPPKYPEPLVSLRQNPRQWRLIEHQQLVGVVDQGQLYGLLDLPFDFDIELVSVNAVAGASDAD